MLLAPLQQGENVSATADGWCVDVAPPAFCGRQSHAVHTALAPEPAGTVLTNYDFVGSMSFNRFADQLLVYSGTQANPMFLCALDNSGGVTAMVYRAGDTTFDACPGSNGGWHASSCIPGLLPPFS